MVFVLKVTGILNFTGKSDLPFSSYIRHHAQFLPNIPFMISSTQVYQCCIQNLEKGLLKSLSNEM